MADALHWIIPIAGIAAVLFALYLARDVLARDTGTKEMQDVAGTIFEGAVAFIRRQYTTIGVLALVGAVVIFVVISAFETKQVADTDIFGVDLGWRTGHRLPRRRRVLDGLRDHRHVHQREVQRPHRRGRPAQPRRGRPGRDARRRRLRLPRRRALAARRLGHLRGLRRPATTPPSRRRRSSSWASASAPASWRCSPSWAAASTPRPRTSAPTSSARSRRASPRTTPGTRAWSPTWSATTSATARAAARTCSSPPPPRTSAP